MERERRNTRPMERSSDRRARGEAKLAPILLITVLGLFTVGGAVLMLGSPSGSSHVEEARVSRRESPVPEQPPPAEPPVPQPNLVETPAEVPAEPENTRREVPSPALPGRPRTNTSPTATNVLNGRVVDPVTGMPVSLFTVHCIPASLGDPETQLEQGQRSGQTFRDQQGKFRVQSLEPGQYSVVVDAPGYKREYKREVQVPGTAELTFEVKRGAYIDGKLLDTAGHPVANYEVNLDPKPFDPKKFPRIRQRKTDNMGYYRFSDLSPGEYRVSMGGLANNDPELASPSYTLNQDQHIEHNFTMPPRNTLTFTITDDRGVALNAVRIRCYDRNNHFNAVTDQNGEAKIEHVRDSEYTLNIVCRGYKQAQEKLVVSGGAATIPVRRVLVKEKQ
jgi:hypothetical protein